MQILAGIFLLGVLVAFHELGHFLFAKMMGVRVLVFSIGFGPKLLSFTKGDTEYRLSAIPLGGYVRMFGESFEQELTDEEKKYSFLHQATWKKSLIAFAGPLFNFILPIILLFFVIVGNEQILLPKIGSFTENSIAQKSGLMVGDLVKEVDGEKVESFSKLAEIISENPDNKLNFLVERKENGQQKLLNIEVTPKAQEEKLLYETAKKVGRIGIIPAVMQPIVFIEKNSPLRESGLLSGDKIIKVNQKEILSYEDLNNDSELFHQAMLTIARTKHQHETVLEIKTSNISKNDLSIGEIVHKHSTFVDHKELKKSEILINAIKEKLHHHFGMTSAQGLVLEVKSGSIASGLKLQSGDLIVGVDGEALVSPSQLLQKFMADFNKEHLLSVIKADGTGQIVGVKFKKNTESELGIDGDIEKLLGIKFAQVFSMGDFVTKNVGPIEALIRSVKQTNDIAIATLSSFLMLVKREVPASQIGGPIMIFDVASQAAQKGLVYYIMLMCMLSINLGILNLLPIPALDGGHLLMFGIEAVQRKPLTPKTRAVATQIGFILLLALMIYAFLNDLSRLF